MGVLCFIILFLMENSNFKYSLEAILSGNHTDADIKEIKRKLNELLKEESLIKQQIDKDVNEFRKNKNKSKNNLKNIHKQIKEVKNILKNIN